MVRRNCGSYYDGPTIVPCGLCGDQLIRNEVGKHIVLFILAVYLFID